jgi:DNA polymerase family A
MVPAQFERIWVLDFEFMAGVGENPVPVCLVAQDARSGQTLRLWADDLRDCPFDLGPRSLFVAYYASAEWNCFLALGWPLPVRCVDLYAEFRCATNNLMVPSGNGLLGAMAYYGLNGISKDEKQDMRDLVLRGGPWDANERLGILDYCQGDVDATMRLLERVAPRIDWPRALLRGRYTQAVARMESTGVPIDVSTLDRLKASWQPIQQRLIVRIDRDYGVYEVSTFKAARWEQWLAWHGIPWPRLESGALALDDDTFRQMARAHPEIAPIRELRSTLGQMRLNDLAVGHDGRNRCLLSPFGSRSGRNQPSTSKFIFGPSTWLRSVIQPPKGCGLAYVDWSQQEFGIAAALSGDQKMLEAYRSGDPYLAFAKQAGAVPADATKTSHKAQREQFKACVLGVQYGMHEHTLGQRIGQALPFARRLLELHRLTYPRFWRWSDAVEDYALLHGRLCTVFGWFQHYGAGAKAVNPRSIRNFPMQANGAEMLRLACCMATEAGIEVCAPVHDAILLQAPLETLDRDIRRTQEIMAEASELVLPGFRLTSDAAVVRYPERYRDERGAVMWDTVQELLAEAETTGKHVRIPQRLSCEPCNV